jgi:hypothetical protein
LVILDFSHFSLSSKPNGHLNSAPGPIAKKASETAERLRFGECCPQEIIKKFPINRQAETDKLFLKINYY